MKEQKNIEVLIIEDDLRIAEIQKRFIEQINGFETIGIAASYIEAKSYLEVLKPDLIILDVYFPDMNGIELLKETKQQEKQMDVIMITAAKEIEKVQEAIAIGVFDYIIKPVVFERFKQAFVRYQEYHAKLEGLKKNKEPATQVLVDSLLRKQLEGEDKVSHHPKGIDPLTLEKVLEVVAKISEGITAEYLAKEIGASRTTARRYLEHLVSLDKINADVFYGTVGRPERVYVVTK